MQEQEDRIINMSAYEVWKLSPEFNCLPCADGCENCIDDKPCIVTLNWVLRTILLILQCIIMCCLPIVVLFTYKYQDVKVNFMISQRIKKSNTSNSAMKRLKMSAFF